MSSSAAVYPLDIAHLIDLAESDPEAFESERKAALEHFFGSIKEDHYSRLNSMQWRIDRERERCANPMDACVKLNAMMWGAFSGDGGLVSVLNSPLKNVRPKKAEITKLIPFKS